METFVLTKDHIKLLTRAFVRWNDCETGAPEIDPKRPYGNSFVAGDVAEIIGINLPDYETSETAFDDVCDEMMNIHFETKTALQIILTTKSFKPGKYQKRDPYDATSWELVSKGKKK
jgi:hypothetical protein